MKINRICIFILLILTLFERCEKKSVERKLEPSGHILFYHIGEQDRPVAPFIIKTLKDTTYLKFQKYSEDSLNYGANIFLYGGGYGDKNIEIVEPDVFLKFKSIIDTYAPQKEYPPYFRYGSFEVDMMDNADTLSFSVYSNFDTKYFFENLEKLAKENNLKKAEKRFRYYGNMQ